MLFFGIPLRLCHFLEYYNTREFWIGSPRRPGGGLHRLGFLGALRHFGFPAAVYAWAFFECFTMLFFGIPLRLWYFVEFYNTWEFWSPSRRRPEGVLQLLLFLGALEPFGFLGSFLWPFFACFPILFLGIP